MTLKQKVHEHFKKLVERRVSSLKTTLQDLIESTQNETKSSAGDKYETGRAMLQIEQDNVRKQLKQALEQKALLENLDTSVSLSKVTNGSLLKTDRGYFYISIALGKLVIEENLIIGLSPQSPLGSKMMGCKTSDTIILNNTNYTIEEIE